MKRRLIGSLAIAGMAMLNTAAVCEGWRSTPEERMACCAPGGDCPMHDSEPAPGAGTITQAQADNCCASSESDKDAAPAGAPVLAILAPLQSVVDLTPFPTGAPTGDHVQPPSSPPHVPKHVLFSVFLV